MACEKENLYLSSEKRMQGKWSYERVTFQKDFTIDKNNNTSEFSDLTIDFRSNGSIEQTDRNSNLIAIGEWDMRRLYFNDGANDNISRYIRGHLTDVSSGQRSRVEWRNLQVNRKRMLFTERKNGGIYRFRLRRQ